MILNCIFKRLPVYHRITVLGVVVLSASVMACEQAGAAIGPPSQGVLHSGDTSRCVHPHQTDQTDLEALSPDYPMVSASIVAASQPLLPVQSRPGKSTANKSADNAHPKTAAASDNKALKSPKADLNPALVTIPDNLPSDTQLDLKRLYQAIHESEHAVQNEVRDEEELSAKNLAMLWQAAVERSSTIRYAIEKLSRRDATGKPVAGDPMTKRVMQSIIHLGGVAGTIMTGSPVGVLGGGMVQELLQGDPQDPIKVRVSDADMLILAREVESLQSQLMTTYYTYVHKQQQYQLATEARQVLRGSFDKALKQNDASQETLIMPVIAQTSAKKLLVAGPVKLPRRLPIKLTDGSTQKQKPATLQPLLASSAVPRTGHSQAVSSFEAVQPLMESLVDSASRDAANARQAMLSSRDSLGLLVGPDALQALAQLESSATASVTKSHQE